jgi:Fe-only nitrogenase accessory protein AnfO
MCLSEIAVFLGGDNRTIPLNEPGTLTVFRRERGAWVKDRERAFALNPAHGLRELRNDVAGLVQFLSPCTVLVAKTASGALYFELEKAKFSVWEIAGTPPEFLDQVWRDEKESQEAAPLPAGTDIPAPLELLPGKFFLSIKEIQGKRPEVSSKQVLQQFVQAGAFSELEIICDHLPPWIEVEAACRGYDLTTERTGTNEMKVVLRTQAGGCC